MFNEVCTENLIKIKAKFSPAGARALAELAIIAYFAFRGDCSFSFEYVNKDRGYS